MALPVSFQHVIIGKGDLSDHSGQLYYYGAPASAAYIDGQISGILTGNISFTGQKTFNSPIFAPVISSSAGVFGSVFNVQLNSGVLTDASNNVSVDWGSRNLYDGAGNLAINWSSAELLYAGNLVVDYGGGKTLYDSSVSGSLNWGSRLAYDTSVATSIDWNSRLLYDSLGNANVHWNQGALAWQNNFTVDWANNILTDSSANVSIDWNARGLRGSFGTTSLKWNTTQLFDSGNSLAENWSTRQLFDGSAVEAANWITRELKDVSAFRTVGWDRRALYALSGGLTFNVIDWANFIISDFNGNSIDWGQKNLKIGSTVSLDWGNRYLSGNWVTNNTALVSGSIINYFTISGISGVLQGEINSNLASIALLTGATGSLQTQITLLNNVTGSYYPRSNPSGYITLSIVTGASGVLQTQINTNTTSINTLTNATGSYYLNSNPSGFVPSSATGLLVDISILAPGATQVQRNSSGSWVSDGAGRQAGWGRWRGTIPAQSPLALDFKPNVGNTYGNLKLWSVDAGGAPMGFDSTVQYNSSAYAVTYNAQTSTPNFFGYGNYLYNLTSSGVTTTDGAVISDSHGATGLAVANTNQSYVQLRWMTGPQWFTAGDTVKINGVPKTGVFFTGSNPIPSAAGSANFWWYWWGGPNSGDFGLCIFNSRTSACNFGIEYKY